MLTLPRATENKKPHKNTELSQCHWRKFQQLSTMHISTRQHQHVSTTWILTRIQSSPASLQPTSAPGSSYRLPEDRPAQALGTASPEPATF